MKKPYRVLLVDDDEDDQLYFRDAINEVNPDMQFDIANNGKEALDQIEIPPPPDLIFLDLNMPIMNGYEFLKTVKNSPEFKNIPVVIVTTSKSKQDIEMSQKLGASLFFTKPSNFSLLCSKLKAVLNLDFPSHEFTF